MTSPATKKLLLQLEPLRHAQRMRLMVEYGRNADPVVLRDLEAGNVFERHMALMTCYSSRDAGRVERGLQDPSSIVRAVALRIAPLTLSDAQAVAALRSLSPGSRLVLLHGLQRRKRAEPICDALLEELSAAGDTRAVTALIGFASAAWVARHWPVMELASAAEWARVAGSHPALVADWLEGQALTDINPRVVWQVNAVARRIADHSSARAAQLLVALRRSVPLVQLELHALVEPHPRLVADLLLGSEDQTALELTGVAHRLPVQQVIALQAQHPGSLRCLEQQFSKFAPSNRAVLFAACRAAWADSDGLIDSQTLRSLPRGERESEALRHLNHPALAARTVQRVPYAALLGFQAAVPLLEPTVKHPNAEFRTAAVGALIRAARFDRSYADALDFVRLRKNEQDPVRLVMLSVLGELPAAAWKTGDLEGLGNVLQDALNAADLSAQTASAAERIVVRLLPFHAGWSAQWIATFVKQHGQINLYNLGERITDAEAQVIAAPLLPILKSWLTREREVQLSQLLYAFGQRLKVLPDFLELAEQLVRTALYGAPSALQLIATYDIPRFNRLVPQLLKADQSWATQAIVYQHLHRQRQDLLTPYLGRQAYKGKFSAGKTRFVLPIYSGFERWTPVQQTTFAATLEELTQDAERDQPAIYAAVAQLSAIPNAPIAVLERLADVRNSRLAIRDIALRCLGRLDEARGLPALLDALGDDRARVAIYALRRLVLNMPSARALTVLRATPLDRVTVAKEVVRLIGELRSDGGFAYLIDLSAQTLHRDVRVALLRALWDDLERDRTWVVLSAAATDPDPAVAAGVIRIPTERLSKDSQYRLVTLLANLIAHPDPTVRLETLSRCEWLPVTDAQRLLVKPLLNAIDSIVADQSSATARAFFATYAAADPDLVRQAIVGLLGNRRTLALTLQAFLSNVPRQRQQLEDSARAILIALEPDILTRNWQVRIALLCLPWAESAVFMTALADRQLLDAGLFEAALTALRGLLDQRSQTQAGLETLESAWREHPHELLRRLALEALILTTINANFGGKSWSDAQLESLNRYRADPSSIVAAAAQFTFPDLELERLS